MATKHSSKPDNPVDASAGYEKRDVNIKGLFQFAFWMAVVLVITLVGMRLTFDFFKNRLRKFLIDALVVFPIGGAKHRSHTRECRGQQADGEADADYLAGKIAGLRIFEDENGKMNLDTASVSGEILIVSQFTLYGDVRRGKRPSFDAAAPPERARQLYEYFVERIRAAGLPCQTGRFQEMMQVELVNDGPVTILLDSTKPFWDREAEM